jgi:hypothetical protein
MEKLIATIAKSETEDICVCLTEYHGRHFVDVRIFSIDTGSGAREPTPRGFSIDIDQLEGLIGALRDADAAVEAAGLRVPPPDIAEDGSESLSDILRAAQALRQMRAADAPPLHANREPALTAVPPVRPPARPPVQPVQKAPALVGAEAANEDERPTEPDGRSEQGLARVIESLKMVQHHIGGR